MERFSDRVPPQSASTLPVAAEPFGLGATVLSSVFALLVGVVAGVIATFTHRQWLPWGLVAGLLVVVALVAGFRLVFDSRIVGVAAAVGILGASAALALPGAGGTALVVDDPAGWVWAIGPAVLSAIVVAWPRPTPARTAGRAPGGGATSA